jgi:hypothetical protein
VVATAVIGRLGQAHLLGAVAMSSVVFDCMFWLFAFLRMSTVALTAQALVVVDRDANCAVTASRSSSEPESIPVRVDIAEWRAFFTEYLDRAAVAPAHHGRDAIVPSPLMPHLMAEWIVDRARRRWPARVVETVPTPSRSRFRGNDPAPTGRTSDFADWICPVNCIGPHLSTSRSARLELAAHGQHASRNGAARQSCTVGIERSAWGCSVRPR